VVDIDGSVEGICLVTRVVYTGAASLDDIRVGVLKTLEAYSGVINLQGILLFLMAEFGPSIPIRPQLHLQRRGHLCR
jgi:hypothetical protein